MRKQLYDSIETAWYTYDELGLDINKMFVTEEKFPNIYGESGLINLGDEVEYRKNALRLAEKLLDGMEDACIFFVPYYDRLFFCTKGYTGEVELHEVDYFGYISEAFEDIGYDRKYRHVGLIEEISPLKWDIIEE